MISRNHFLSIFINDLPLLLDYCLFTDDAKTIAEIKPKLQHDCITSKAWAEQNKMLMHYDKASCMIVGTRHRTRESPNLNIMMDNNKTKQVHYQNSVGRCVIPCAFLVKVSNIYFLVENVSCLRKKMFTIFLWRFNVTATSQSDVSIFNLFKA